MEDSCPAIYLGSWLTTVALLVLHAAAAVTRIVPADLVLARPPPRPKHLFHRLGLRHELALTLPSSILTFRRCPDLRLQFGCGSTSATAWF